MCLYACVCVFASVHSCSLWPKKKKKKFKHQLTGFSIAASVPFGCSQNALMFLILPKFGTMTLSWADFSAGVSSWQRGGEIIACETGSSGLADHRYKWRNCVNALSSVYICLCIISGEWQSRYLSLPLGTMCDTQLHCNLLGCMCMHVFQCDTTVMSVYSLGATHAKTIWIKRLET